MPASECKAAAVPEKSEGAQLADAIDQLYDIYLQIGDEGTLWLDGACSEELFRRSLRDCSGVRLLAVVRTVKRWRKWLQRNNCDECWHKPSTQCLGRFFLEVEQGGPTAAAQVWGHLDFLRNKMGLQVPTRAPYMSQFKCSPGGHTSRQAPELAPWIFINLLSWTMKAAGSAKILGQMILMVTMGCVRWAHVQRSVFKAADERSLTFWCPLGKAKFQGARRPFTWMVPRFLAPGVDVLDGLPEFLSKNRTENVKGLIPDVYLQKGRVMPSCEWKQNQMPMSRFIALLKGVLVEQGLEDVQVAKASYNSLRRFLPSLGDSLGFSTDEAQSLSNWTEIAKGQGPQRERASHPMSRHYAATKEMKALLNKHKAVVALQCLKASLYQEGKLEAGILREGDISWNSILKAQPDVYKAEELVCTAAAWGSVCERASGQDAEALPQLEDAETTFLHLPFMFKLKKSNTVHFAVTRGSFMPRCRDRLFASKAEELAGVDGNISSVCEKCSERASSAELDAVHSWFGE